MSLAVWFPWIIWADLAAAAALLALGTVEILTSRLLSHPWAQDLLIALVVLIAVLGLLTVVDLVAILPDMIRSRV
jgi:hypothetical protein